MSELPQEEPVQAATESALESRLGSLTYQWMQLYHRWAHDQAQWEKQMAEAVSLVNTFAQHIQQLEKLESTVRQQMRESIHHAAQRAIQAIGERVEESAGKKIEATAAQLARSVQAAEQTLQRYEDEMLTSQWKIIGVAFVTTVTACLLAVWLLIPRPVFPLTDEQIQALQSGEMMAKVWPKLSKKEQQHWQKLADGIQETRK